MSNLSSILKWAWQAHFWSHRPVTLQNCTFSEYVQMILLALFKISYNKKFEKNPKAFMSISVACPWTSLKNVQDQSKVYELVHKIPKREIGWTNVQTIKCEN